MSESMSDLNSIQEFFVGKTIFITGASGLVGKVLIEKLLHACSGVEEVMVLMSAKNEKTDQRRVDQFAKHPIFKRIIEEKPEVMKKIFLVFGEITKPNFDLSDEHLKRVMENAEIVFHMPSLLRMKANLKPNILMNLVGTKNAVDLANKIKNLIQFVHLSTAFCNGDVEVVDEKVYDFEHNSEDLINISEWMGDKAMKAIQNSVVGVHLNSFTYTQRLAEILVRNEYESLPVSIVRPSVVTPLIPRRIDSSNGPNNLTNAAGKSIMTNLLLNHIEMFEMISVDTLTNALILITKDLSTRAKKSKEIPVYHLLNHKSRQLTEASQLESNEDITVDYPFSWAMWLSDRDITHSVVVYKLKVFFFVAVPAHFIDFLVFVFGQQKVLLQIQKQIDVGYDASKKFSSQPLNFKGGNINSLVKNLTPEEYNMFPINTEKLRDETVNTLSGARQCCIKDSLINLPPPVQNKVQRLLQKFCKYLFWYFFIRMFLHCFELHEPLTIYLKSFGNRFSLRSQQQ